MVEHVRRRALLAKGFCCVVVATCDRSIAEAVEHFGGQVVMTSAAHPAATDRVAEAARHLECTHVVNVQGDEILVLPSDLEKMLRAMEKNPDLPAWNGVAPLVDPKELTDPSVVKCAVSRSGRILFCSRVFSGGRLGNPLPRTPLRRVLGILGYRKEFLDRYGTLSRTPLETAESIDQSRIIEHDFPLQSVEFSNGYPGINEPREIEMVHTVLREDPLQETVLKEVLAG